MTVLLGIDLGRARIGLAVADGAHGAPRPLATMRRGTVERDAERLANLASDHGVTGLVVGLPLNMDGTEGPQALETREWAGAVLGRLGLPLRLVDERLTSIRAEQRLPRPRRARTGAAPSPAARSARRAAIDREAARLILQAALDDPSGPHR